MGAFVFVGKGVAVVAKEYAKGFYNSPEWRKCRAEYVKSVGGVCERCGCELGDIVHHKVYLTPENIKDASIALSFDNLELLCRTCHNTEHMGRKRRYRIKPDGTIEV